MDELVAVLVVMQLLTGGAMEATFKVREVQPPGIGGAIWVPATFGLVGLEGDAGLGLTTGHYGANPRDRS